MPIEIITSLVSSIVGGLLVALVNILFTRKKTLAETEKLKAEAEKLRAEAEKVRVEIGKLNSAVEEANYYISSTPNEQILYDGSRGIEGYDITGLESYTSKNGVLIFQKPNQGFALRQYIYDGKKIDYIPKNELIAGERKLRVSCEAKVLTGAWDLIFVFESQFEDKFIENKTVTIDQTDWAKTDLYFRLPPQIDCLLRIYTKAEFDSGSLQLRNLIVAEHNN